ncbi:arsenate reductase family protein [Lactococcus petauri]|uniref:arsenate reductase family protein n=1 Tax=Lactococcus petauri TaxID=1940789 RepID=UPI00254D44DC|nr:arsenate reductase family protein [Lactococcus petauri]
MINVYCNKRCTSSTKAISWFKRYGIEFCIKPSCQISRKELITVLSSTDKGFFDVDKSPSSLRDEKSSKLGGIETMSLDQAINYIKAHPKILKSPIIIEKKKVLIGYSPEQIRIFLPRAYRRKVLFRNIKDNDLE